MKFLQTFNWQTYDEARKGGDQASHTARMSSVNAHQINTRAAHSVAKSDHETAAHVHGKAEQEARAKGLRGTVELHNNARRNHQQLASEHAAKSMGEIKSRKMQL
jgi:hypothetical protein